VDLTALQINGAGTADADGPDAFKADGVVNILDDSREDRFETGEFAVSNGKAFMMKYTLLTVAVSPLDRGSTNFETKKERSVFIHNQ